MWVHCSNYKYSNKKLTHAHKSCGGAFILLNNTCFLQQWASKVVYGHSCGVWSVECAIWHLRSAVVGSPWQPSWDKMDVEDCGITGQRRTAESLKHSRARKRTDWSKWRCFTSLTSTQGLWHSSIWFVCRTLYKKPCGCEDLQWKTITHYVLLWRHFRREAYLMQATHDWLYPLPKLAVVIRFPHSLHQWLDPFHQFCVFRAVVHKQ